MTIKVTRELNRTPRPEWNRVALAIGGTNPYGEPLYRVSWANSCLMWSIGEYARHDEHGRIVGEELRHAQVPRYPINGERWIIEFWKPSTYYGTPEEWRAQNRQWDGKRFVDTLGTYPARGDHEQIFVFEDVKGGYVEPTATVIETRIQEHRRQLAHKEALIARIPEMQRKQQADSDAEVRDWARDAVPASYARPMFSYAGLSVPSQKESAA